MMCASSSPASTSPNASFTVLVMFPFHPGLRGSWMYGPESAAMASWGSRYAGSSSYVTSMRSSAAIAVSSSTAATAATPSPM